MNSNIQRLITLSGIEENKMNEDCFDPLVLERLNESLEDLDEYDIEYNTSRVQNVIESLSEIINQLPEHPEFLKNNQVQSSIARAIDLGIISESDVDVITSNEDIDVEEDFDIEESLAKMRENIFQINELDDEDEFDSDPDAMVDVGEPDDSEDMGGLDDLLEPGDESDASLNVDDMIDEILQVTDKFDADRLYSLPPERIQNIYNRFVVGESVHEELQRIQELSGMNLSENELEEDELEEDELEEGMLGKLGRLSEPKSITIIKKSENPIIGKGVEGNSWEDSYNQLISSGFDITPSDQIILQRGQDPEMDECGDGMMFGESDLEEADLDEENLEEAPPKTYNPRTITQRPYKKSPSGPTRTYNPRTITQQPFQGSQAGATTTKPAGTLYGPTGNEPTKKIAGTLYGPTGNEPTKKIAGTLYGPTGKAGSQGGGPRYDELAKELFPGGEDYHSLTPKQQDGVNADIEGHLGRQRYNQALAGRASTGKAGAQGGGPRYDELAKVLKPGTNYNNLPSDQQAGLRADIDGQLRGRNMGTKAGSQGGGPRYDELAKELFPGGEDYHSLTPKQQDGVNADIEGHLSRQRYNQALAGRASTGKAGSQGGGPRYDELAKVLKPGTDYNNLPSDQQAGLRADIDGQLRGRNMGTKAGSQGGGPRYDELAKVLKPGTDYNNLPSDQQAGFRADIDGQLRGRNMGTKAGSQGGNNKFGELGNALQTTLRPKGGQKGGTFALLQRKGLQPKLESAEMDLEELYLQEELSRIQELAGMPINEYDDDRPDDDEWGTGLNRDDEYHHDNRDPEDHYHGFDDGDDYEDALDHADSIDDIEDPLSGDDGIGGSSASSASTIYISDGADLRDAIEELDAMGIDYKATESGVPGEHEGYRLIIKAPQDVVQDIAQKYDSEAKGIDEEVGLEEKLGKALKAKSSVGDQAMNTGVNISGAADVGEKQAAKAAKQAAKAANKAAGGGITKGHVVGGVMMAPGLAKQVGSQVQANLPRPPKPGIKESERVDEALPLLAGPLLGLGARGILGAAGRVAGRVAAKRLGQAAAGAAAGYAGKEALKGAGEAIAKKAGEAALGAIGKAVGKVATGAAIGAAAGSAVRGIMKKPKPPKKPGPEPGVTITKGKEVTDPSTMPPPPGANSAYPEDGEMRESLERLQELAGINDQQDEFNSDPDAMVDIGEPDDMGDQEDIGGIQDLSEPGDESDGSLDVDDMIQAILQATDKFDADRLYSLPEKRIENIYNKVVSVEEGLGNGYGSSKNIDVAQYFPSGAVNNAPSKLGPSAATSGNNPMATSLAVEGEDLSLTDDIDLIHESLSRKLLQEMNWDDASKEEFKRNELQTELGHETPGRNRIGGDPSGHGKWVPVEGAYKIPFNMKDEAKEFAKKNGVRLQWDSNNKTWMIYVQKGQGGNLSKVMNAFDQYRV